MCVLHFQDYGCGNCFHMFIYSRDMQEKSGEKKIVTRQETKLAFHHEWRVPVTAIPSSNFFKVEQNF